MEWASGRRGRDAELQAGDALRAWALMSVVCFHITAGVLLLTTGTYDFEGGYGKVAGSLILGMQTTVFIFFALSAFLLSRPFIRAVLEDRPLPSFRRYGRHRVGRIVPAFWVAILVIIVAYGRQGSSGSEILALLGFAQVYHHGHVAALIDHAWSLDVEALFYLVLPLVAWASARAIRRWRRGGTVAVAGIVLLAVAGILLEQAGLDPVTPVTQSPLGGLRSFLPGILLAVLAVRHPGPEAWLRLPRWTSGALLVAGVFLLWAAPHWAPTGDSERVFVGTLSGGCIFAAVVIRQFRGGGVWLPFRGPLVAWVGDRSYSIFLVHGVVYWAVHDIGDGQPIWRRLAISLAVAIPAIFAAAEVLHRLVEKPAMDYSRRPRPGDRRVALAGAVPGAAAPAVLAPAPAFAGVPEAATAWPPVPPR
ncbi:acyltransferase [Paraconexibacter antarcticus]|uniref:Acyltransferase n=1 Tax=Paraconexibacter antarcticus TaxID=2949664 RepID=A0ABY5DUU2_9ACTN|nr:acyltransferase [Paraconexibacter antarcticus]UTI64852.1 acyltransferase [Paraconexibacter antarcticus]